MDRENSASEPMQKHSSEDRADRYSAGQTENRNSKRNSDYINKVVLVQLAVCAFIVALVFAAWKFSPNIFALIRNEYNEIMSVNVGLDDVRQTIDNVTEIQGATGEEEQDESEIYMEDESEKTTESQSGSGGEDSEVADTAVAAMASLGSDKDITVPLHGRITSKYPSR